MPPGPPVQAPLVAEIYGPFQAGQQQLTRDLRKIFEATEGVVDVDDSLEAPSPRLVVAIDRQKAAMLGVNQAEAVQTLAAGLGGLDATYARIGRETYPIPVRLELEVPAKADLASVLALQVRSHSGARVPLSEITTTTRQPWENAIYHKDLLPMAWGSPPIPSAPPTACLRHVLDGRHGCKRARCPASTQYFFSPARRSVPARR